MTRLYWHWLRRVTALILIPCHLWTIVDRTFDAKLKQESPPAWTQEAYRPPCSKYSLYCPNWVPNLAGYPPSQGTPLGRVPPRPGYPPSQGTPPRLDLAGYPPRLDLAGYPPPPAAPWHSGKCCKALWDMGTPPPPRWTDRLMDGWMEGQTRVKTLPSRRTTYAGGNYATLQK